VDFVVISWLVVAWMDGLWGSCSIALLVEMVVRFMGEHHTEYIYVSIGRRSKGIILKLASHFIL
jgi:hypothetical protein